MNGTIMVVDDASAVRKVISLYLRNFGFTVIEAQDGADALERVNGNPVDLFICDVNMPNMDGLSFLKRLKSDGEYSEYKLTPFIMLTTESEKDRVEEGKKAGARGWLLKPFKPEQLLDAVKEFVM